MRSPRGATRRLRAPDASFRADLRRSASRLERRLRRLITRSSFSISRCLPRGGMETAPRCVDGSSTLVAQPGVGRSPNRSTISRGSRGDSGLTSSSRFASLLPFAGPGVPEGAAGPARARADRAGIAATPIARRAAGSGAEGERTQGKKAATHADSVHRWRVPGKPCVARCHPAMETARPLGRPWAGSGGGNAGPEAGGAWSRVGALAATSQRTAARAERARGPRRPARGRRWPGARRSPCGGARATRGQRAERAKKNK